MKTCNDIKILMQAFIDGELAPDEKQEFVLHLENCKNCQAELENAKKLNKLLAGNLTKVELPPYFEAKLWARIEQEKTTAGKRFWLTRLVLVTVSAICVMLVATVAFNYLRTAKPEIYVVSPETNSIVSSKDVTISAAIYNKPKAQRAQLVLNGEVVADEKGNDQIIYTSDKELEEGYYKIKVQLIDKNNRVVKEKEQLFYVVPNGHSNDL